MIYKNIVDSESYLLIKDTYMWVKRQNINHNSDA